MQFRVQDWFTNILGTQSVAQFGAQQAQPQHDSAALADVGCSSYHSPLPKGYDATSVILLKDNLAVVPEWSGGGVRSSWLNVESVQTTFVGCMQRVKTAGFIAFHGDFLDFIGRDARLEMIQSFVGEDAGHVHEAPVYVPQTGELVFADTSVTGWLWAVNIDTHEVRKIRTNPPLQSVNGGTIHASHLYFTTNGGSAPAIYKCSLPTKRDNQNDSTEETIDCSTLVNNYRLAHLNSPNDLIFTSSGNLLFTDPTYGWAQSLPGVGPPELPTAIYHFDTKTKALTVLSNNDILQPNGLALSADEQTLYVADSNSTSGKPIGVWEDSVRNVYAFDFDDAKLLFGNKRLVHVVERGWPDGLRVTKLKDGRELVLVASMGGVDVVDVSRGGAGILLGKWNVGDDIVFNLESARESGVWLLTGLKGVYKVKIAVSG